MGFYSDDLMGSTSITANTWYHVAYVYNLSSNTKSVYLNGILDGSTTAGSSYQGTSGAVTLGIALNSAGYFNGYLDQVSYFYSLHRSI